jgi:electron transport complex protein RnfG
MNENAKMILVLTLICGVCGFLLAGVRTGTKDQIEKQVLTYVKGPAVENALASSTNNLIDDSRKVTVDGEEITVFVGKKEGGTWAIAFETSASGFGGDIGVIVGFDVENNKLAGIGITTCTETPGLGLRVKEENFTNNFRGKSLEDNIAIKSDDGVIDAVSGASISSKAVCTAVNQGIAQYEKIKQEALK